MPSTAANQVPTQKVAPPVHPLKLYPEASRIYCRDNYSRQIFDLGNGQLYKFRPHRHDVYESDIHALIRSATNIPIPIIYYEWVTEYNHGGDGPRIHHMVMEKIEGEPLSKVYAQLNPIRKGRLVLQLTNYLGELRRITSLSLHSFAGGPLYDEYGILFGQRRSSGGPFFDDQSLWLALTSQLQQNPSDTIQQALIELRSIMPQTLPAVLTHTDLHKGNILVRNGHIVAIIDWEGAGFFPNWMEYVRYHPINTTPEWEFENAILAGMEAHPVARRFMAMLNGLRGTNPATVDWASRLLER